MHRRALLATAATSLSAIVAGCSSVDESAGGNSATELPTARLELTTIPDAQLPTEVLYTVRPGDRDGAPAELLDQILEGDTTTEATDPPLPAQRHIAYQEAVYELSHEVIEETAATEYVVRVDVVTESVTETEAIEFAELPAVDRDKFAANGLADGGTVGVITSFLYTDAEREESVLVPESDYSYIRWDDGTEAEWAVDEGHDRTLNSYRYTGEQVATAAEYGQQMRERFAFDLSGLSEAQREIVETAIADESYSTETDETPSDAFAELIDQFRDQEQVRGLDEDGDGNDDPSGRYLVRYQDEVYWTALAVRRDG